jgi:ribose transport system ATP-binding protein
MTVVPPSQTENHSVLRASGVSKTFGATRALDGAGLVLHRGEIHALLGGNGSGKSTFIKALAGVQPADAGTFVIGSQTYDARTFTAADAHASRLRFVHQQLAVFGDMTVAENLAAGRGFPHDRIGRIRWGTVRREAAEVLSRFEIPVRPTAQLGDLSPALQMMVAVARALQESEGASSGVLVLDEATAALTGPEVELLRDALRRYAAAGQTVLFVTHRLGELPGFADRVTALRDGRVVCDGRDAASLSHDDIVDLIVGTPIGAAQLPTSTPSHDEASLQVRDLRVGRVNHVSFSAYSGEILGVAGLVGSGRSTLLKAIFGSIPDREGEVLVGGAPLPAGSVHKAISSGVAYVSEDRTGQGIFADMTVRENLSAAVMPSYRRLVGLRERAEARDAEALVRQFHIKTESQRALVSTLSGGNQQKVVLARWMRRNPRVLLLDDPTQGVDIGARHEIYNLIRQAASAGAAVIVVSSDFDEIADLCDRVLVVVDGRVTETYDKPLDAEVLHRSALSWKGAA